jgi:hypothetical protein
MPSDYKHTIRIGVVIAVISSLVVAAILWLLGWLARLLGLLLALGLGLAKRLTGSIAIPFWLFYLLLAGWLVLALKTLHKPRRPGGPSWRDYTEDRFPMFGEIVWRWDYSGVSPVAVGGYCPRDQTHLVYSTRSANRVRDSFIRLWGAGPQETSLKCETCDKEFGPFAGDLDEVISAVCRQIDRKLRSDEWKEVVAAKGARGTSPGAGEVL